MERPPAPHPKPANVALSRRGYSFSVAVPPFPHWSLHPTKGWLRGQRVGYS